jgi:hypothetical protein
MNLSVGELYYNRRRDAFLGSVSRYLAGKIQVAKFILIAAATILPPWYLAVSTEGAAITRYVDRQLSLSEAKDGELVAGDVVSVSGRVQGDPLSLPDNLRQFGNALMVVERLEERTGSRPGGWLTARRTVWTAAFARIGRWQLNPDLIQRAGFIWYRPSPCGDYRPPQGWVAQCGGSPYAIKRGDDDRRLSYEVAPITDHVITLIAAVSPDKGMLSPISITWSADPGGFAFLVWSTQEPHAVLASRLKSQHQAMLASCFVILAVVVGWMSGALRKRRDPDGSSLVLSVLWRAVAVTAPLGGLFLPFDTWTFIPAIAATFLISAGLGFQFWRLARQAP